MPELLKNALTWPDRIFIIHDARQITYKQFYLLVLREADRLLKAGANKGHIISILLPCSPEFAFSFFGAQMLGGIPNPINIRLHPEEIAEILEKVQPKVLVTTPQLYKAIHDVKPELSLPEHLFPSEDKEEAGSTENIYIDPPQITANDPALLLYTSGTSGKPRGVLHSYGGISSMLKVALKAFQISIDDNFLCVMPLHHAFGLAVNLLASLAAGAKVTLMERFVPDLFLKNVADYDGTVFAGVPTMYNALLRCPLSSTQSINSMRLGISGGSPMAPEVKTQFSVRFKCRIVEAYGTTEAFITHMLPYGETKKRGCIGKVLDDSLYMADIVGEANESLPPFEIGELVLKSPSCMKEYFSDPEETARVITNGWLRTGDSGFKDEEDFFYLVGRNEDIIKRGGEKIVPLELERVLCQNPKVSEAIIIGVEDSFWGQEIKAFVVVKPELNLSKEEVYSFCSRKLAKYKCPKRIEFVDFIPKDLLGKPNRRLLREMSKKI